MLKLASAFDHDPRAIAGRLRAQIESDHESYLGLLGAFLRLSPDSKACRFAVRVLVLHGYVFGSALMFFAALVTLKLGVAAERKSLEDVATPLSHAPSS